MSLRRGFARVLVALVALAAAPAFAQNFLWRVDSLASHVWLFGTIHAGKAEWYPLPKAVDEAFADSPTLVVEADITDKAAMDKYAPAMAYAPPDSLRNHVPPQDYARMLKLLPRYGIPESQVAQMKPFIAASLLVFAEWTRLGYLPQLGVDTYLLDRAKDERKAVVELEGVATQAKLMDTLTPEENRLALEGTLGAIEQGLAAEQIEGMVHAWQVGDPNLMLEVARRYDEKVKGAAQLDEKFVWSRHDAMVAKISGWLEDERGPRFIAVGALHLAGPRGLVAKLRERGYGVKQIFVAPAGEKQK
ncbi:MAG TPA: TraB/GumN family protein [Usitatibacter sp.]|nr:TraB/GumN family protein [Usitatibacter sp.]